jgi:hypothetical protein
LVCGCLGIFGVLLGDTSSSSRLSTQSRAAANHRDAISTPIPVPLTDFSPTPSPRPTVSTAPKATVTKTAAPKVTTHKATPTKKPTPPPATCGAPSNPFGFNFCGKGGPIYSGDLPGNVCGYFACIPNFSNGHGYMVECNDATYSMSGGIQGACSHHSGEWREVYSG